MATKVKAFVITGDRNSGTKKDFTGAFDIEARKFMALHGIPAECRLRVDLSKPEAARKKQVLDFVADMKAKGYETNRLAMFCHGFTNRVELGFRIANVQELVNALLSVRSPGELCGVILYCCSTGGGPGKDGDNGFADKLRDTLCQSGETDCVVEAHVTAGHTTTNPHKRRYMGMGSPVGGTGGIYLVAQGTPLWAKWRKALQTDFRFQFPWMTIAQIHDYLLKAK
jgi:hypothetical protein